MKKLVIHHFGPIDHVELNLKRINLVIGPQSSGKSCILKIACFCAWAEKCMMLDQGLNGFADKGAIEEYLTHFYLLEGYWRFGDEAYFSYECSHLCFSYHFDTKEFIMKWKRERWNYKRSRVSYIPAERNLVSAIPNWMEVSMSQNHIRSFVTDWNTARIRCQSKSSLPILDLGVSYYYDKQMAQDVIRMKDGKPLVLGNASSGLQSVIPMWVYLDFLFRGQYETKTLSSVGIESQNEAILQSIYSSKFKRSLSRQKESISPYIGKIGMSKLLFASEADYLACKRLFEAYSQTSFSDIYLEEPEQNLFPKTQVELLYQILRGANEHQDQLFIATHSPYVLYAMNNCLLSNLVKRKMSAQELGQYAHIPQGIRAKEVSVWEIRDGCVNLLQDGDGLIRGNYFDNIMKQVMADFVNLSAYYE